MKLLYLLSLSLYRQHPLQLISVSFAEPDNLRFPVQPRCSHMACMIRVPREVAIKVPPINRASVSMPSRVGCKSHS